MIAKNLTEYHLEFLSLKESCRGSSESTLSGSNANESDLYYSYHDILFIDCLI